MKQHSGHFHLGRELEMPKGLGEISSFLEAYSPNYDLSASISHIVIVKLLISPIGPLLYVFLVNPLRDILYQ